MAAKCGAAPVPTATFVTGAFVPDFAFKGGAIVPGRYRIVHHHDLSASVQLETPNNEYTKGVFVFGDGKLDVWRSDGLTGGTEESYGESYEVVAQKTSEGERLVGKRLCGLGATRNVEVSLPFSVEGVQIVIRTSGSHVDYLQPE